MREMIDQVRRWFLEYPRFAALLLGLIAATGFAPLDYWWLTLLGIGALVALLARAQTSKSAFAIGWFFGWSHFTLGSSWMAHAFTYQTEMPAILGWIAPPMVALYLAIYPGLAALLAQLFWSKIGKGQPKGLGFVLAFAAAWMLTEWLRGWAFTGYPWNPLGIILIGDFEKPGIAAIAALTGTYALSGIAIFVAGLFWRFSQTDRYLATFLLAAILFAGMQIPGDILERKGTVHYTVVQPDVRQDVLNNPAHFEANFAKAANLSRPSPNIIGNDRVVFWPESGLPDYIEDGYPPIYYQRFTAGGDPKFARRRISRIIGKNALLLTGAVDLEFEGPRAVGARNSITAVSDQGEIIGSYAKSHLVPFGEYVPLRSVLEPIGIARFVPGAFDFLPGPGPATLDFGDKGKVGMLVCYEIIFSGNTVDPNNRPDYIFNPSNDGWYGYFGPPQHLAQARLRAIEEGLPVIRATTTGVSAVIDAYGVVRDYAPMRVAARLEGTIPPAREPTLFARLGNFLTLGWAALFILLSLLAMRLQGRVKTSENSSS